MKFLIFLFSLFGFAAGVGLDCFSYEFKALEPRGIVFNPATLGIIDESEVSFGGFYGEKTAGFSLYFLGPNFNLAQIEQEVFKEALLKKSFLTSLGWEFTPALTAGLCWELARVSKNSQVLKNTTNLNVGVNYFCWDRNGNQYIFKILAKNVLSPRLFWQEEFSGEDRKIFAFGVNFIHFHLFSLGVLLEFGEEEVGPNIYYEIHLGGIKWYRHKKVGLLGEMVFRKGEGKKFHRAVSLGLTYTSRLLHKKKKKGPFYERFLNDLFSRKYQIRLAFKIIIPQDRRKESLQVVNFLSGGIMF
jgi:hypothetical protein